MGTYADASFKSAARDTGRRQDATPRFTIGCLKARREREMKSHIQNENEREFYFLRAE